MQAGWNETLVTEVATHAKPARLVSLEDRTSRDAALIDPTGFVAEFPKPAVIDEVQRASDLLLAIKERQSTATRVLASSSSPALRMC